MSKNPSNPRSPSSRKRRRQEEAVTRITEPNLEARAERQRIHAGKGRRLGDVK